MSHLSLIDSQLIPGQDYSHNQRVNALIDDPMNECVILYPGPQSINLSPLSKTARRELIPHPPRRLVIFVIDGTWATARKMMRLSRNLGQLPRLSFTPDRPSNFRVRKQPKPECYSTIEAIYHLLELLQPDHQPSSDQPRPHQGLLRVFDFMVERQLQFIRESQATGSSVSTRKVTYRKQHNQKALQSANSDEQFQDNQPQVTETT